MRRAWIPVALLLLGCSDGDDAQARRDDAGGDTTLVHRVGDPVELGDETSFLVRLSPQEGDGTVVVVDEVVLTGSPGFVVIYDDGDGAPGRQIGVSDVLTAGRSTDVRVELDEPLEATAVVHAMLHLDDDGNSAFDYPAHDAPATAGEGIVVVSAEVMVNA